MSSRFAPLRIPAFRRLAAAYAVNGLGDWVGEIALSIAVFHATDSAVAVVALWTLQRFLPALLTPAVVTRLERLPGERLLPGLYLFEGLVFAALAWTASDLLLGVALALAFLDGLAAPVARALSRAAIVSVTRPAGLHREGNAVLNVIFTASAALGPALGGALVLGLGAPAALLVDAASFLAAAAALGLGCRLPPARAEAQPFRARLRAGLGYVRRRPVLCRLLCAEGAATAFFSAVLPIEIVYVTGTLGSNEAGYGAVLTAWGAGMVLGGLLDALVSRLPLPAVLAGGAAAQVAAYLGMGAAGGVELVAAWSVIGGIGNGLQAMALVTAVQERASDAFQARVNGLYEAVMTAAPGVGFLLGGAVAAAASPRAVYLVAGLGALAVLGWAAAALRGADWSTGAEPGATAAEGGRSLQPALQAPVAPAPAAA